MGKKKREEDKETHKIQIKESWHKSKSEKEMLFYA